MKQTFIYFAVAMLISCNDINKKGQNYKNSNAIMTDSVKFKTAYADVNGISLYYEVHGQGKPLVFIHGGGSTIQSSFERIIPLLAKYYMVIAVELQNHGRSGFRNVPQTFEQDADDVSALLGNIGIGKASFFGFSNGGTTAMQIGIRHPEKVDKLVLAAAAYKREGLIPGFFDGMQQATIANMPQELKTAFLKVNADTAKLQLMFEKDRERMVNFEDISDDQVRSINAPALVINGDADVVTLEHSVEMVRLIKNSRLAIIPGGHGKYIGEITTPVNDDRDINFVVSLTREFLDSPTTPHTNHK